MKTPAAVQDLVRSIAELKKQAIDLGVKPTDIDAVQENTAALKTAEANRGKAKKAAEPGKQKARNELYNKRFDKGGKNNNCMLLSLSDTDVNEKEKLDKEATGMRNLLYRLYDAMLAENGVIMKTQLKSFLAKGGKVSDNQVQALLELKAQFKTVVVDLDNPGQNPSERDAFRLERNLQICANAKQQLASSNPYKGKDTGELLALVDDRRAHPTKKINLMEEEALAAFERAEDQQLLKERKRKVKEGSGTPQERYLDTADMLVMSTLINTPIECFKMEQGVMGAPQAFKPNPILGAVFVPIKGARATKYLLNVGEAHFQTFEAEAVVKYCNAVAALETGVEKAEAECKAAEAAITTSIETAVDAIKPDDKQAEAFQLLSDYSRNIARLIEIENNATAAAPPVAAAAVSAPPLPAKYTQVVQPKPMLNKEERAQALRHAAARQLFDVMWVLWTQGRRDDRVRLYKQLRKAKACGVIVLDSTTGYGEPFASTPSYIYLADNFKAPVKENYGAGNYIATMINHIRPFLIAKKVGLNRDYESLIEAINIEGVLEANKTAMTDAAYEQKLKASASTTESLESIGWRIHQNTRASAGYLASEIERQEEDGGAGLDDAKLTVIRQHIHDYRMAKTAAENKAAEEAWSKDPKNRGKAFVAPKSAPVAYDPKTAGKSPI